MSAEEEQLVLASLRASLAGRALGGPSIIARVTELAARLNKARYSVVVVDGETPSERSSGRADSLIALTQALNAATRCSIFTLRAGATGTAPTWCSRGRRDFQWRSISRAAPHATNRRTQPSRESGAARSMPCSSSGARARCPQPCASAPWRAHDRHRAARERKHDRRMIRIDTGVAGIHESGMALRTDDLPLPVRSVLPSPRDTASLLEALGSAIAAQTGAP